MSIEITSRRSPRVLALRQLKERAERERTGLFIVEGEKSVQAAQSAGVIDEIWIESGRECAGLDEPTVLATPEVMAAVSDTVQPPGVLAVCHQRWADLTDVFNAPGPIVVADRISDPGNLGTLIRTLAAVGGAGLLLTEGCVDPYNPKVVRSTAGTIFAVHLVKDADATNAAAQRGERPLVVTDMHAPLDVAEAARTGAITTDSMWVVGSEAHGVSRSWRESATVSVRIPMAGGVESLNAAVSAAICLYVTQAIAG